MPVLQADKIVVIKRHRRRQCSREQAPGSLLAAGGSSCFRAHLCQRDGNGAWKRWAAQQVSKLRIPVEHDTRMLQLGQAVAPQHHIAQHILVDAQLVVDLLQGLWWNGELKLPDVGLQSH